MASTNPSPDLSGTSIEWKTIEEAHERMERAVGSPRVLEQLYAGFSAALEGRKGPRTSEDELIDALSAGVQQRRSRVKPAPPGPGISAVMVLLNLELGHAPEMIRAVMEPDRSWFNQNFLRV